MLQCGLDHSQKDYFFDGLISERGRLKDQYKGYGFDSETRKVVTFNFSIKNAVGLLFAYQTLDIRYIRESVKDIKVLPNGKFIRKVKATRKTILP